MPRPTHEPPEADGDCAEANLELFEEMCTKGMQDGLMLCQGMVTGQGAAAGWRFQHVWIELNGIVFDASNGQSMIMSAEIYYQVGRVSERELRRYDASEVARMTKRRGLHELAPTFSTEPYPVEIVYTDLH